MMKGRLKELNSLKEMGAMTTVKRSEAAGERVIQTRWVDREKDGRAKSRLVLKDCYRCQERTQPEMFSTTPSTLSLKTILAASSRDRNNHPECDHITTAIDVHTAFLHAAVDQELSAPESDEGMNQSCAKTKCRNRIKCCTVFARHRNCANTLQVSWKASITIHSLHIRVVSEMTS